MCTTDTHVACVQLSVRSVNEHVMNETLEETAIYSIVITKPLTRHLPQVGGSCKSPSSLQLVWSCWWILKDPRNPPNSAQKPGIPEGGRIQQIQTFWRDAGQSLKTVLITFSPSSANSGPGEVAAMFSTGILGSVGRSDPKYHRSCS